MAALDDAAIAGENRPETSGACEPVLPRGPRAQETVWGYARRNETWGARDPEWTAGDDAGLGSPFPAPRASPFRRSRRASDPVGRLEELNAQPTAWKENAMSGGSGLRNVVVVDATLWDGTGRELTPHSMIEIRDGKIVAVGLVQDRVPDDIPRLDADGRFVIPGLIGLPHAPHLLPLRQPRRDRPVADRVPHAPRRRERGHDPVLRLHDGP